MSILLDDDEHLLLAGSSLSEPRYDDASVVDLSGTIREGGLQSGSKEIIAMHTRLYTSRPGVRSIIDTHSPFATAFAVANRPMPLVAESLARLGVAERIGVAAWAPRGSQEAVDNILSVTDQDPLSPAVLLGNHGVLGWGDSAGSALDSSIAVEENAQLAYYAEALGGATPFTSSTATAARARRQAFEEA
jgi:L-fuculose-phosphate aldolase